MLVIICVQKPLPWETTILTVECWGARSLRIQNIRNGDYFSKLWWAKIKFKFSNWTGDIIKLVSVYQLHKDGEYVYQLLKDGEYAYSYETDDVQWTPFNSNLQMQGIKVEQIVQERSKKNEKRQKKTTVEIKQLNFYIYTISLWQVKSFRPVPDEVP